MDAYTRPPTSSLPPQLPPSALAHEIGAESDRLWPLADPGRRILAAIVDRLIAIPLLLPGMAILGANDGGGGPMGALGLVLFFGALVGFIVYQCWLLSTEGQTLAKRWFGLRIVDIEDQGNPGFVRVILLRGVVSGLIGSLFSVFYVIADASLMFYREDRRTIHDLLASTEVVDERAPY